MRVHEHVSLREPFISDGIVEVGVIVGIGVVIPDGHSVERKVDLVPAKICAPFIDGDSEREVGEVHHLTDYVDGIFGQNRLKECVRLFYYSELSRRMDETHSID